MPGTGDRQRVARIASGGPAAAGEGKSPAQVREGLGELLRSDLLPTPACQKHEPAAAVKSQCDALSGSDDGFADAIDEALG